jgi:hypothetical protein
MQSRFYNVSGRYDEFSSKTAADLYLEIMEHNYFLSQRAGKDVDIAQTAEGYWQRFH